MTDQERIAKLEAGMKLAWDIVCEVSLLSVQMPRKPFMRLDKICRELGVLPGGKRELSPAELEQVRGDR